MKKMKKTKSLILWILTANLVFILLGCTNTNATKEIETNIETGVLLYSQEDAKMVARSLLTTELKDDGFDIVFDKEVELSRIEYRNPFFYRFLIEDEHIALETAILINKETGSPLICYPDDTYVSVNDEELFASNRPFWYGSYGKVEAPDNFYTVLTVTKSLKEENSLYIVTNSYFGAGTCVMKMDAKLVEKNKAVCELEDGVIEIVLNNDNSLIVNVESEDLELKEMLHGNFR